MAKKRNQQPSVNKPKDDGALRLADVLGEDVLSKLKEAKQELSQAEAKAEEARMEQALKDKKEREANKSFAELLDEYDGKTRKY
ncbi:MULTISPECIES: YqkE family protein [unclassified Sporosarcina]|uniref:YqkE family protein n=1 Tax=unclassified Sporosarcina TaxID=2647733 RepID=UPI000579DFE2|nr:YqkE family protein [Sporosarcina sp. ZBG7A]